MSEKKPRKKKTATVAFQTEFYSDLNMKDMWYAKIVRCPAQSGSITSITTPDLPDEYYFFTARNVPGKNIIDTPSGKIPLFCEGSISYKGEPVGIIAGPDEKQVNEYAQEVVITVDETPLESYLEETDKSRELFSSVMAQRVLEEGPCFTPLEYGTVPGLDSVFEKATLVSENTWCNNIQQPDYGEPDGAICSYKDGHLEVYAPTQWVSNLRDILMQSMGLDANSISIHKTKSLNLWTNGIWYNSVITAQAAIASYLTGHAIKLMFSRDEQNMFMNCIHEVTIKHKSALDAEGTILAMQIDISVDAGSYNPFAKEIIDRLVIASMGCYEAQNVRITATAYRSSKPPSSFNFHTIDSSAFYALENQINELSRKSSLSPVELRKKNISQHAKKSGRFNFGLTKIHETLDAIASSSDFNRKYAAYHLSEMQRKVSKEEGIFASPLRGVGFSCAFEGSGYYGSELYNADQEISLTKEKDGTAVILSPPVSNSIRTIWTEITSTELGVAKSAVKITSHPEDGKVPLFPDSAYSSISVMTQLLKKCCAAIKKSYAQSALPITVKRRVSPTERKAWNNEAFSGKPFHSASFAAATIEVEIDPCTFTPFIRNITVIINGGKLLNYKAAESAVKLSLQKVLSSLVENETLSSASTQIMFIKSEDNPMQIGSLVPRIIPAAYTQALTQAIGTTITTLPLKSHSLFSALHKEQVEEAEKQDEAESTEEEGRTE